VIGPGQKPIHLDTSFLIRALDPSYPESRRLLGWFRDRRTMAMSALAWGKFLCGPLSGSEEALARRIAQRFVAVGVEEATLAARLFNQAGRRRSSFLDCVIAATAINAGAELATSNREDFELFVEAGLELTE
jgi:predicted nucleic acid-binding protein